MSCCNDVTGERVCAVETVTISCVPAVDTLLIAIAPITKYGST